MTAKKLPTHNLSFEVKSTPVYEFSSDEKIVDIACDLIDEIDDQKFIIHQETIDGLIDGIKSDGQLEPCIVVPSKIPGRYDLLAGRHRKRACEAIGIAAKCVVRNNLSERQKRLIILNTNLDRNNDYLPSELAFAYKEKVELEGNTKKISEETHISRKKIYRYIRLTYLIAPLLERVDKGSIPLIAAVELSYLSEEKQRNLFEFLLNHSDCKITTENARIIKETPESLNEIFYPVDESENIEVDNLSTLKQDVQAEEAKEKDFNSDVSEIPEKISDCIEDINLVDPKKLTKITSIFIKLTHIDILIIKNFLSTSEVTEYIKEMYARDHQSGSLVSYIYSFKNKFEIRFVKESETYFIAYSQLDLLVRRYIREHYSSKQITEIFLK